jgi:stearoyl-CoA desaturase (delta-9 desaturase)
MPRDVGLVAFSPAKSAWLWVNLAAALWVLWAGVALVPLLAALVLTFLTLCIGHSVGLHRGIIHETFVMRRWLRYVLVGLFVLTGLGGPLAWIQLHYVRDYWQNQRQCPAYFAYRHSLVKDFYWNLHCAFVPTKSADKWRRYAIPVHLTEDAYLRFLQHTWWIWNCLFFVVLWLTLGLGAALVLGPARVAGAIVGHWIIGFWTHKYGDRPFAISGASETGSNSVALGWISFGEGFHNNHHAFPESARIGHKPWELDIGWWVIRLFEHVGLVRDVRCWSRGNAPRRC